MAKATGEPGRRLGILVGGGPAPGINGVIGAATLEALRRGLEVVGIYDGFKWLADGDAEHVASLTAEGVDEARFRGGSILRTSRKNPTKTNADLTNTVEALRELRIGYLVTIGGDDTAYSASKIAQTAGNSLQVVHVPKTIDNDLPLPRNTPTFGFQTAREVGSRLIWNLMADARTTQRWYIAVVMGRSAGHLALGMGTSAGVPLTLIPEEFVKTELTLNLTCDIIEGSIIKSNAHGRPHGVAVIAEGLGLLMEDELESHPLVVPDRDDHGHLRMGGVPLALILGRMLEARAAARKQKTTFVDVTIGYELRCADPVAFDVEYTRQLGWGAVEYLMGIGDAGDADSGPMISVQDGKIKPIPFHKILNPKTGKTRVRTVKTGSDQYRSARAGMVRLEPEDFRSREQVRRLATAANLSQKAFRGEFAHVAT